MSDIIIFTRGVPPPEAFPTEQLVECFDAALRSDAAVVLQYGQQPGYTPLRRLLAEEYSVTEREIMVETRLIPTSKYGAGGALRRERVLRYLRNTLRERNDT